MFKRMLDVVKRLQDELAGAEDPVTDLQAMARIELANLLARVEQLLSALSQEEGS